MAEDRSNFRPKVGETYQLRGGGVGSIISDDLSVPRHPLAVEILLPERPKIIPVTNDGLCFFREDRDYDLMPPPPEKKYRPWTLEELKEFAKSGAWVRKKGTSDCGGIHFVTETYGVAKAFNGPTFATVYELFEDYTQDDEAKTPCGVEVVE